MALLAASLPVGEVSAKDVTGLTSHAPILILGDVGFVAPPEVSGVTKGTGTLDDPYVIEGWRIDASDAQDVVIGPNLKAKAGIFVSSTTRNFIIHNVWVHRGGSESSGIRLSQVSQGAVVQSRLTGNRDGISGRGIFVSGNLVERNELGIAAGDGAVVTNNILRNNGESILLSGNGITVAHNTISNDRSGAIGRDGAINGFTSNSTLVGNVIVGSEVGIQLLSDSKRNLVSGNLVSKVLEGIILFETFNTTVSDNMVLDSDVGILLHISWGNNVTGNVVRDADTYAIASSSSGNNDFQGNQIWDSPRGIWILGGQTVRVISNRVVDSIFPIVFCHVPGIIIENNVLEDVENPPLEIPVDRCPFVFPPPEP